MDPLAKTIALPHLQHRQAEALAASVELLLLTRASVVAHGRTDRCVQEPPHLLGHARHKYFQRPVVPFLHAGIDQSHLVYQASSRVLTVWCGCSAS